MDIRNSFMAGLVMLIVGFVFTAFSPLTFLFPLGGLVAVNLYVLLQWGFYALFMLGYVSIGKSYSKRLMLSSLALLILPVLFTGSLLLVRFTPVALIPLGLFVLGYMVSVFVFGVSVGSLPVVSHTKKLLSRFARLEGIFIALSLLTLLVTYFLSEAGASVTLQQIVMILPLFVLAYVSVQNFLFRLLFLYDTYRKEHTGKVVRNRVAYIVPLSFYLFLVLFSLSLSATLYLSYKALITQYAMLL